MFEIKYCKYSFIYYNIVDLPRIKTSKYGKNYFKYTAAVLWNDKYLFRIHSVFKIFKSQSLK